MHVLLMVCLLGADAEEPRPLYEVRRSLSDVMRREAGAKTDKARARAIYDMTVLYEELKRDPRRELSPTLASYKTQLWSRLTRIKRELSRKFDDGSPRSAAAGQASQRASQTLASHIDLVGHSLGGPLGLLSQARHGSAAAGGAAGPRGAAGGGPAAADFGPALVELIERTIAPDFWDVNGGPGSIVYYRPLHALVVRASGEIHGDLGGLLGKLR